MIVLRRKITRIVATLIASITIVVAPLVATAAFASTSLTYNFDSSGELSTGFNSYVGAGSIIQVNTGGLSNTGAVNVPTGSAGVFTTKTSYSMGPVGSTYVFASYMFIDGSNGYGGMGFTSAPSPTVSNTSSSSGPLVPVDALGISVHGGGFIFHNGATDYTGLWSSASNGGSVISDHASNTVQLLDSNPAKWWKVLFTVVRQGATTFDMQVEVRPTDVAGVVIPNSDYAIMSVNGVTSSVLANAPSINTYFNFSMDRVRYFDNYSVNLQGGSSVIQAGTPVVLTTNAIDTSNVVTFDGAVTGSGGASVTERGFVYSTTSNPTTSDNKVPVGSGIGTFQGLTSTLPNGTYYFRAYATNATGTSYGVEEQLTLSAAVPSTVVQTPALASTGHSTGAFALWGIGIITIGLSFLILGRQTSKNS